MKKKRVLACIFLSIMVWIGGFAAFIHQIRAFRPDYSVSADAIIVLTGGSLRVKEGIELLKQNRAEKLLISGVAFGTDANQLLKKETSTHLRQRIDADPYAYNTASNAIEAAYWMKKNNFTSAILVTAQYHLPRSLVHFHHFMPHLSIIPYPVFPAHVKLDKWWRYPGTTQLLITEFCKYMGSSILYFCGFDHFCL